MNKQKLDFIKIAQKEQISKQKRADEKKKIRCGGR